MTQVPPRQPQPNPMARILIIGEGNSVSLYADGLVTLKVVIRPVARSPAGNDKCDEILEGRVGVFWSDVHVSKNFRLCFFTDERTPQEIAGLKTELGR